MKKYSIIVILAFVGILSSCNDDYLERLPETSPTKETFFTSAEALELYTNSFYGYLSKNEYENDYQSDNMAEQSTPEAVKTGLYSMPVELGSGGWKWTQLRDINYFIENCKASKGIAQEDKDKYLAVARFFRARFYFRKVKRFGDVPWYSKVLGSNDEELYKARDPRTMVMDSVLADLNFAVQHAEVTTSKNRVNKWTALALKSRVCLYEGSWRKYHTEAGLADADKFLTEAANAAGEIINSGLYSTYNTGSSKDYYNLFNAEKADSDEVIMAIDLAEGNISNYNKSFTTTSVGRRGITKSLVHEYLMSNGNTFQSKYADVETLPWYDEFTNRDPRLAQTSMPPNFHRIDETAIVLPWFGQNHTGYQVVKRVGPAIYDNGDPRDIIVFRLGEVLLNYAEALAELGTITQADLDKSINELRKRVRMPKLSLTPALDSYLDGQYKSTSNPLILEIRRERRVELAIEGFRFDDLMRWKEGHLLRDNAEGIYVTLNTYTDRDQNGVFDLYIYDGNKPSDAGSYPKVDFFKLGDAMSLSNGANGRLLPYNKALPSFGDWEYLSPIPLEELTLNPKLKQNPEWEKINP
ncbi:RagB/SusD family nutrient uptake outer membrane protein [Marinifilum caeruleilacunae]|uniref:RagB/SusD family nutrient uptake outer membrane protein n=1 Tax=Marinifilum caeruleilacunae TaxID=2499076 RepID=A0ABX1WRK4_9BACT|nr:RagB/SusD family nutrient uptake outer membrane protein [Marinifilum caeruleilacunae]NOU58706.1 RagB/SusD family nutrient uptake outer membrane protein [Marinifilum caeruleilacunae]